jgi:toxin FitB
MNIADSSVWVEFFTESKSIDECVLVLKDWKNLIVPSVVIFEVCRKLQRDYGVNEAMNAALIMQEGIVVDFNQEVALNAVSACFKYHLPAMDSMILSTAQHYGATLWTMDKDFEGIEGVKYFPKK